MVLLSLFLKLLFLTKKVQNSSKRVACDCSKEKIDHTMSRA